MEWIHDIIIVAVILLAAVWIIPYKILEVMEWALQEVKKELEEEDDDG